MAHCLSWCVAGEAEILTLLVDPVWRRQGLGRALVRDLFFKNRAVFLEVRARNAPALALYRGLGFVVSGHRRAYYADGSDALCMRWQHPGNLSVP